MHRSLKIISCWYTRGASAHTLILPSVFPLQRFCFDFVVFSRAPGIVRTNGVRCVSEWVCVSSDWRLHWHALRSMGVGLCCVYIILLLFLFHSNVFSFLFYLFGEWAGAAFDTRPRFTLTIWNLLCIGCHLNNAAVHAYRDSSEYSMRFTLFDTVACICSPAACSQPARQTDIPVTRFMHFIVSKI